MDLWTTFNQETQEHEVRGNDPQTGDQTVYFASADFDAAWA